MQSSGVIAAPKISEGMDLRRYMLTEMALHDSTSDGQPLTLKSYWNAG